MIRREVIAQLVDLVVGDASPVANSLFAKGSRKRAPSSHTTVVLDKQGNLPTSAKNIPDWTDAVRALSLLCRSSCTESMITNRGIPSTLLHDNAIVLDPWSTRSLRCRPFFATCLKQSRYVDSVMEIMCHSSHEFLTFSNECSDVLLENLSFSNVEGISHAMRAIERYMGLNDSYMEHRIVILLTGENGILSLMKSSQSIKGAFVCVCMRSLLYLTRSNVVVRRHMSQRVAEWAPWMLKFCYQYVEKCKREAEAIQANTFANAVSSIGPVLPATAAVQTGPKGSYLHVLGESDEEREITWTVRAEKTFTELQEVIRWLGGQPDTLIPLDTFEDVVAEAIPDLVSDDVVIAHDQSSSATKGNPLVLSDAMTDEELAAYLAQSYGLD